MDFSSLFSNIWNIALVVLFFGGSIFVHELGHFLAARRRGVHVERFSIGFGPAIFSWRGKDGVEYRLSWLPLGGYVALPQLADMAALEGSSRADLSKLPPLTYATKVIVFVAGAVFNVVFAFLLASILWLVGYPETPDQTRIGYVVQTMKAEDGSSVKSPAATAGLRAGDVIVSIDNRRVETWNDIMGGIALGTGQSADGRRLAHFSVEREGKPLEIDVYPMLTGPEKDRKVGITSATLILVSGVKPGTPAEKTGFVAGDELLRVDATSIYSPNTLQETLDASPLPSTVTVRRQGKEVSLALPKDLPQGDLTKFGFDLAPVFTMGHPSPFAQLASHASVPFTTLGSIFNRHSDVGISKISGPLGILRIFSSAADAGLRQVIWFTILINVSLAIFNLLPIPVLDGGHILFATIAKLRGRNLPINVVATTQSFFMVLLLTLIVYVSYHDVLRWQRDRVPPAAQK